MAKTTKSGLGRGLNSLLGGSGYEPAAPSRRSPAHERLVIDGDEITKSTEREQTPAPERLPRPVRREVPVEPEPEQPVVAEEKKDVTTLPLKLISPNPDQPRTTFKPEEIEELSHSIEKDGLLQPILVRPTGNGTYQIIAGERRWQACTKLGLAEVPVVVREIDDDKSIELALIENIQRADLNPIEEAYGYKRLMERKNMTQADVAQAMSKGRSTVANILRLLELPEDAQQLLFEDKMTPGHARAILSIPNEEGRHILTRKIAETKLSVREAESLARLLSGKQEQTASTRPSTPNSYKKVAKAMRDALKTNVRVKTVKGKNKIEIEFKDEEELERLFNAMIQ